MSDEHEHEVTFTALPGQWVWTLTGRTRVRQFISFPRRGDGACVQVQPFSFCPPTPPRVKRT